MSAPVRAPEAAPGPAPRVRGPVGAASRWLAGYGFPAFTLATLALSQTLLLALLLAPVPAGGELAAFADDFKVWCFGYDPSTGQLQVGYAAAVLLNPLVLAAVVLLVWWAPLREALRGARRGLALQTGAATLFVAATAGGVGLLALPARGGELPFPAERLRTALPAAPIELINQDGQPVSLAGLRGRVVLVTAVYATCGYTCPMIMGQTKSALAALDPALREDLTVLGVTLDAERDRPEVLASMARGQGVSAPAVNLLTGDPATVEGVLDAYGVARSRNAETGVIDHANLFVLIDRQGRIAYRFTLGDRQERWLVAALRLLLAEPAEAAAP